MTWMRLVGYWLRAWIYSIASAVRAGLTRDAQTLKQRLVGEWNAGAAELEDGRTLAAETWIFRPDGTATYIPRSSTRFAVEFRYRILRQGDSMTLQLVRSGFVAREAVFELIEDHQLRLQWQDRSQPGAGRITSRSTLFHRATEAIRAC